MTGLFSDNPLRTRDDLQQALRELHAPLKRYFSPGAARVKLGFTGAQYTDRGAEMEGFSRALWGVVPLAAGGAAVDWEPYLRGLTNGADPRHEEYWGEPVDRDQRFVEMAAIGFALALAPEQVWEPLESHAKENLARWLNRINDLELNDSNWLFFLVMVNEGLATVGAAYDSKAERMALDRLESFYLGDGWYSDGPKMQRDYYVAFAMHYYGLLYSKFAGERDPERARRFRERASLFAQDFIHWFADDGSALPFGRSLTYRFAQGAFWGALAFADVEALPWGTIKGLTLRHLRWWAKQPISNGDGTLSIGYAYPNLNMAEEYNSPGSPYWAMKFFLPLALPETHPFWQAEESVLPDMPQIKEQHHPRMILCRNDGGHVFALGSGQYNLDLRHGPEKYAKFAYSTAFGFSVRVSQRGLEYGAHDSMLALSDDGVRWRVREELLDAKFDEGSLYSLWMPWPDVEIETWLLPRLPWHVRVHHLKTERKLATAEGGFSLDRTGDDPIGGYGMETSGKGFTLASYPSGCSGLRDLREQRTGQILRTKPNANLVFPRAVLPTLLQDFEPGEYWLACAVLGLPGEESFQQETWDNPPQVRDIPQVKGFE